jgi:hypothetical protein
MNGFGNHHHSSDFPLVFRRLTSWAAFFRHFYCFPSLSFNMLRSLFLFPHLDVMDSINVRSTLPLVLLYDGLSLSQSLFDCSHDRLG